jgi:hypothetical protein
MIYGLIVKKRNLLVDLQPDSEWADNTMPYILPDSQNNTWVKHPIDAEITKSTDPNIRVRNSVRNERSVYLLLVF